MIFKWYLHSLDTISIRLRSLLLHKTYSSVLKEIWFQQRQLVYFKIHLQTHQLKLLIRIQILEIYQSRIMPYWKIVNHFQHLPIIVSTLAKILQATGD